MDDFKATHRPEGRPTKRGLLVASLFLALLGARGANAQKAHAHSANGGQVQAIGTFEAELVVKQGVATLYVVDDQEKKVDASGFSATASVLAKGNNLQTIELKPSGENKLSGAVDFPTDSKFRATITLKADGKEIGKGRYNLNVQ